MEGQPNGCPSVPRRVYSCSIPNQGCWLDTISIIRLQVYRRFVSRTEKRHEAYEHLHLHSSFPLPFTVRVPAALVKNPRTSPLSTTSTLFAFYFQDKDYFCVTHDAKGINSIWINPPFPLPRNTTSTRRREKVHSPADWRLYLKTSQRTSLFGSLRKGSRNMAAGRRYMSLLEPSAWKVLEPSKFHSGRSGAERGTSHG